MASTSPPAGHRPRDLLFHISNAGICITIFIVLGLLVSPTSWDLPAVAAANEFYVGWVRVFTDTVYWALAGLGGVAFTAALATAVGIASKSWRRGVTFAISIILTWSIADLSKNVFHRPRPSYASLPNPGGVPADLWSYPSGHNALIAGIAVALAAAVWHTRARRWGIAGAVLLMTAMCATVMIRGIHFPSDAIGSMVLAIGITPLVWGMSARLEAGATEHPPGVN